MDVSSGATDRSKAEPVPPMPSLSDYWPDRPGAPTAQPNGPRHAVEPPQRTAEPLGRPAGPPRRAEEGIAVTKSPQAGPRRTRLLRGVAALALLIVVSVVAAMVIKQANAQPASFVAAPAVVPDASAASPVPTGPAAIAPAPTAKPTSALPPVPPSGNATKAPTPKLPSAGTFDVAATAESVTVRSANLGTDLYRVNLGKSAGRVTAKVSDSGTNHRFTLVKKPGVDTPPVTITLNSGLRWSLKLTAGNTETDVNLTQSKLVSLELAGGARVFNLALPPAQGNLPLRITKGMNQLKINTNGAAVRVKMRVGAGKVILDGVTSTGIKPGQVLTSAGGSDAANRVDLDSTEGVGTLTVDTD